MWSGAALPFGMQQELMAIWWPHSLTWNFLMQLRTSKLGRHKDLIISHPNSSNTVDGNVALGSVISFPHVSATYQSQKYGARQQLSHCPSPTNQSMIWGATALFRCCVCHTNCLSASSCFVSSELLTLNYQITKLVFDAVARLFNRWLNWPTTLRLVLRKSRKLVWCLWTSLQIMTLYGTRA